MCGIAGIVSNIPLNTGEHLVQMMLSSIAHRGPNGEDMYIDQSQRVVLGHRRLSIIDPTLSMQPMHYHERGLVITFNGCIYNYLELRSELTALGHRFVTSGDTEVILKAYAQWGTSCVEQFNGIFAFAIWDQKDNILFCARDRIGVKPFYYHYDNGIFQFCSEIKGLLKSGLYFPTINNQAMDNYFTYQFFIGSETLFYNIFQLEPGYSLLIKEGKIIKQCYWSIDRVEEEEALKEENVIELIQELLHDAIKLNLRSDVRIGAYLSGGFDSTIIVLLSKILEPNLELELFTGAFSEFQGYDESHYAKLVAQHTNFNHHIAYFNANDFEKNICKIIWHMDHPTAGIGVFPQYMLSKLVNQHVKVVLGGQGGDEIFAGYTRYFIMMIAENLYKSNKDVFIAQFLQNKQLAGYQDYFRTFVNRSVSENLQYPNNYFYLIQRNSGLFRNSDISKVQENFKNLFYNHRLTSLKKILIFDIKTHLRALLHVEDRVSMANGLESRVPLLDHRLVELMLRIPSKLFQGEQKSLLKKAMQPIMLPEIMNRTDKMGFPVPFNQWVNGELRDYIIDTLAKGRIIDHGFVKKVDLINMLDNNRLIFNRELWGALCLELWLKEFIVN